MLRDMTRLVRTIAWVIITVSLVIVVQQLRNGSLPGGIASGLFAAVALQISNGTNPRRERFAWGFLIAATASSVAQILKMFETTS
jgi:hypothetical protein